MKNYCKVFVTNIKSDDIIPDTFLHKVICNCTIEGAYDTEKEACRIFSLEEYGNVIKYGFYYIEDLDVEILKMKYRISYDKHFTTQPISGIPYGGREIDGLSIYFLYKYYGRDGKELFFEKDSQPVCFYRCIYDKTNGYKMELLADKLKDYMYSEVQYEEENAFIWYTDTEYPVEITLDEAKRILIECCEGFDNSNNYPAQNLACSSIAVE